MMTKNKFDDIIYTMIQMGMLDPFRAMIDKEYFMKKFNMYVEAANNAREIMHMKPLI